MLNGPFILGALTMVDALVLGILISVAYGSFGYRKGSRHGLGKEGFKTYAIWGWSGPRRLDEKIRAAEKAKLSDP